MAKLIVIGLAVLAIAVAVAGYVIRIRGGSVAEFAGGEGLYYVAVAVIALDFLIVLGCGLYHIFAGG